MLSTYILKILNLIAQDERRAEKLGELLELVSAQREHLQKSLNKFAHFLEIATKDDINDVSSRILKLTRNLKQYNSKRK